MKALCVHGVGKHSPQDPTWKTEWTHAVQSALGNATKVEFCEHDDLFVSAGLSLMDTWEAIRTLGGSFLSRRSRGLFDGDNAIGWTAGMVTQWAGKPNLRKKARERLRRQIDKSNPDIIFAHSLGSLIAYDLFSTEPTIVDRRVFVSLGSQINNPFVQGIFAQGVHPLSRNSLWIHLFNPHDIVFTAELHLDREGADNFHAFQVPFADGPLGSHTDINKYLNQSQANQAWPVVGEWLKDLPSASSRTREIGAVEKISAPPVIKAAKEARREQRALLIGINKYQTPTVPTLAGCVNDCFLVSAALQESGFKPEEIRMVLDDRATTDGIQERLEWLFEDVQAGDMRFLYFSGHGVRLPAYSPMGEPDRMLEALVPTDFDGTRNKVIADRDLSAIYHGFPMDARLIMAFDCCHSGGLSRAGGTGGGTKRTFELPDDIRHRMLEWNVAEQMWQSRSFSELMPGKKSAQSWKQNYVGAHNDTERIGRSVSRRPTDRVYDKLKKETAWKGPYLPMILEACGEDQLAEEYAFGDISYGIFTYAFCHVLRTSGSELTFQELLNNTRKKIKRLGYSQEPEIVGPSALLSQKVPLPKHKNRRKRKR